MVAESVAVVQDLMRPARQQARGRRRPRQAHGYDDDHDDAAHDQPDDQPNHAALSDAAPAPDDVAALGLPLGVEADAVQHAEEVQPMFYNVQTHQVHDGT